MNRPSLSQVLLSRPVVGIAVLVGVLVGTNIKGFFGQNGIDPYSVVRGDIETVSAAIEGGADINRKYKKGATLVSLAALKNRTDILDLLLSNGANIVADDNGMSPLMIAALEGHTDIVTILLSYSVDVNEIFEKTGGTALHGAAMNGHIETLAQLLEAGASPDIMNYEGATPSLFAAQNGYARIIEKLHAFGAEIDAAMPDGRTPLRQAVMHGHMETVRFLVRNNADINYRSQLGVTPLMVAVDNRQAEAARFLIAHGANVRARTPRGSTALDFAKRGGSQEVIDLIEGYM